MRILIVIEGDGDQKHHAMLSKRAKEIEKRLRKHAKENPSWGKIISTSEFLRGGDLNEEFIVKKIAEADGVIFMQYATMHPRLLRFISNYLILRNIGDRLKLRSKFAGVAIVGANRNTYGKYQPPAERMLFSCNNIGMRIPSKGLAMLKGRWPHEHEALALEIAGGLRLEKRPHTKAA